jgi:hypothetical protein
MECKHDCSTIHRERYAVFSIAVREKNDDRRHYLMKFVATLFGNPSRIPLEISTCNKLLYSQLTLLKQNQHRVAYRIFFFLILILNSV